MTDFKAMRGKTHCWGSGYLGQTKTGRWYGQYTVRRPDGTKRNRSVYADPEEECEKLLAAMITEMKMGVVAEKERLKEKRKVSCKQLRAPSGGTTSRGGVFCVCGRLYLSLRALVCFRHH